MFLIVLIGRQKWGNVKKQFSPNRYLISPVSKTGTITFL